MHHLTVKSNLVETGSKTTRTGFGAERNDLPVCPEPRRLGSAIPEFLKPLRCSKHSQSLSVETSELLDIIAEKTTSEKRETICSGCSTPACYNGSPPSRTENPLVHDVQFIRQMELFSPLARTNLSHKFGFSSASPI